MKKSLTQVVLEDTHDLAEYSSTVFYDSSFGSGSSGGSSFGTPGLGSLGDCSGFRNLFSDKPSPSGPLSQPIEPIRIEKEEIEFSYEKPDLSPRVYTPPSCFGSAGGQPCLSIRDIPASNIQLHIHEEEGGKAHFRTYKREKIEINSYDAAMLDFKLQQLGFKQYKK